LNFIIMCILLFKLAILICKCFCPIDDFTICLWHLNGIQYVENQMWWKNEPPYLVTTPRVIFVDCDLVAIIYWQPFINMVRSLPIETPNISFSNMWNILLNTFCCLHVYVIYFYLFVCFLIYGLQESIFHCSFLVLNPNAHEFV